MKVKIKRIDKSLPLPVYETAGSVGFDLLAREEVKIGKDEVVLIPTNIIVETPKGYMLLLSLRSSAPKKFGLLKPHGVGIIDQDYAGEEDEVKVQVYNFSKKAVVIDRGEKIAQGIFVKIGKAEWKEVDKVKKPTRGGFGSTDRGKRSHR
ncbi:MAG: dUTPase [Candidatus Woykebacteria bacterium RBG_13_40_7b]|uniref:dUTP diphosphatase n=1 Tax=Candidatus Woykebacteria bacterium RBG_13_40_7b TaxID=1802594 RepID=A0A1G1WAZ0_9BACT|nr:MAG: dUTPase [Candidatus Woykebacteria bacterium RBG_13_40_7b]